VEAAQASSISAEVEIPPSGVSFLTTWQSLAIAAELAEPVFICARGVKEKSG